MPSFKDLPRLAPHDWAAMLRLGHDVPLDNGRVLFAEGSPGTHLYVVKEGLIEVLKESLSGTALRVAILDAGTVFGERALFSVDSRSTTAQAFRETVVVEIGASRLNEFLDEHPAFAALFYRAMSKRLHQAVCDLNTDVRTLHLRLRRELPASPTEPAEQNLPGMTHLSETPIEPRISRPLSFRRLGDRTQRHPRT